MHKFVWFNNYLPQTLQLPIWFGYLNFAFALLFGLGLGSSFLSLGMLLLFLAALGSFGIANLRLWGYGLAVFSAVTSLAFDIYLRLDLGFTIVETLKSMVSGQYIISTLLKIAIIVALLHPVSTLYVKNNFEKTIP